VSSKEIQQRQELIDQFIASFEKLDEMTAFSHEPITVELATGDLDEYGLGRWRPRKVATEAAQLETIYTSLAARFPPLFEELVLSYRWAEVDLKDYRLVANPPGADLSGLLGKISKDPAIWICLSPTDTFSLVKAPTWTTTLSALISDPEPRAAITGLSKSTMRKSYATTD
jgi:hypothetical protein